MDLSEAMSLITIRDYIIKNVDSTTLDKATVSELNKMVLLVDRKIVEILRSTEFKSYINYSSVNKVLAETHKITHGVFDEAAQIKKSERK